MDSYLLPKEEVTLDSGLQAAGKATHNGSTQWKNKLYTNLLNKVRLIVIYNVCNSQAQVGTT